MTLGLWMFVIVVAANVLGLALDATLTLLGLMTVTHLVRTSQPWIGGVILGIQFIGVCGLFLHFYPDLGGGW